MLYTTKIFSILHNGDNWNGTFINRICYKEYKLLSVPHCGTDLRHSFLALKTAFLDTWGDQFNVFTGKMRATTSLGHDEVSVIQDVQALCRVFRIWLKAKDGSWDWMLWIFKSEMEGRDWGKWRQNMDTNLEHKAQNGIWYFNKTSLSDLFSARPILTVWLVL